MSMYLWASTPCNFDSITGENRTLQEWFHKGL